MGKSFLMVSLHSLGVGHPDSWGSAPDHPMPWEVQVSEFQRSWEIPHKHDDDKIRHHIFNITYYYILVNDISYIIFIPWPSHEKWQNKPHQTASRSPIPSLTWKRPSSQSRPGVSAFFGAWKCVWKWGFFKSWGFLKSWGIPKTLAFNMFQWSNDLDDLGGPSF